MNEPKENIQKYEFQSENNEMKIFPDTFGSFSPYHNYTKLSRKWLDIHDTTIRVLYLNFKVRVLQNIF